MEINPIHVDSLIIFPGERFDVEVDADQPVGIHTIRTEITKYEQGTNMAGNEDVILNGQSLLVYETSGNNTFTSKRHSCTAENKCTVFNCPFKNYPLHLNKHCISLTEAESHDTLIADIYGTKDTDYEEVFLNWAYPIGSSVNARRFVKPTVPLIGMYFWTGLKS